MSAQLSGPELRAAVAERVMGIRILTQEEMITEAERVWKEQPACRYFFLGFEAYPTEDGGIEAIQVLPKYDRDPAATMEMLEKMRKDGWSVYWKYEVDEGYGDEHVVTLWDGTSEIDATAKTFGEAACRAALLAMEGEVV